MTLQTDFGLSLNTHDWGGSFGVAVNRVEQMQPNWILLLHGGESHRLRAYSPKTNFVQREDANDGARRFLRKYEGKDNDQYQSPESYARRRFVQVNELDFIQPFNEIPSLANGDHAKWYTEWCLDFMQRCVAAGRRAAIGTVPVTTLTVEGWMGIMEVLKVISAHPDLFRFLITDYSNGLMTSGANGMYPPHFKNDKGEELPETGIPGESEGWYKFSPTAWPKVLNLSMRQWIAGRWTEMLLACEAAGFDPPPTVCIETGVDVVDKNVVEQWTKTLLKRSGYDELRGWRSYERQWTDWIKGFPDPYNKLNWVQYHLYGRLWQRDVVYRPYKRANGDSVVESTLDFMGTLNGEWVKGFNTMDREFDPFYFGYLEDREKPYALPWRISQEKPMPLPKPPTANEKQKVRLVAAPQGFVNVRNGPAEFFDDIGDIQLGDVFEIYRQPRVFGRPYWWLWAEGTRGGDGWVAEVSGAMFEPVEAPPRVETLKIIASLTGNVAPAVANLHVESTFEPTFFAWELPDGTTNHAPRPMISLPTPGEYTVRVTAMNDTITKQAELVLTIGAAPSDNKGEIIALVRELVAALNRQSDVLERVAVALERTAQIEEKFVPQIVH